MVILAVFEEETDAGNIYEIRLDSGPYKVAVMSGLLNGVGSMTIVRMVAPSRDLHLKLNLDEYRTLVETVLKVDSGDLVAYPIEVI